MEGGCLGTTTLETSQLWIGHNAGDLVLCSGDNAGDLAPWSGDDMIDLAAGKWRKCWRLSDGELEMMLETEH